MTVRLQSTLQGTAFTGCGVCDTGIRPMPLSTVDGTDDGIEVRISLILHCNIALKKLRK